MVDATIDDISFTLVNYCLLSVMLVFVLPQHYEKA